ncbi:MAG: HD domain-containing protein [Clostridium butyricum]|nr:HD domain-containing protein [Clostridium butyricum]
MTDFIEVNINNLETGMILAEDIVYNDKVILTKGKRLNKSVIDKINKMLILGSVRVYSEEVNESNKIVVMSSKVTEYIRINQVLNKISELLHDKLQYFLSERSSSMNELSEFHKIIYKELEINSSHIIKSIIAYGSKTDSIYRHSVNVAVLGAVLGKWLEFSGEEINSIIYAGILSNFGKLKIDYEIIHKKSRLTDSEYEIMKTYPKVGYEFLKKNSNINDEVLNTVLTHHEREDGSGYPLGMYGTQISKFAKIIAIADVFDAINSKREYKEKMMPFEALRVLEEEAKGKLDKEYCMTFISHIINFYLGEYAVLSNGEMCKIIQMNINSIESPFVYIEEKDQFVDLSLEKEIYIKEIIFK